MNLSQFVLLAQETPGGDKASWAMSYLLVGLFIALGLMAVCRPGSRTAEIKRQDDDEE